MRNGIHSELISSITSDLNSQRENYRDRKDEMDRVYIRWGYATEPRTYTGWQELNRLMEMAGEPIVPPYEGQSPETFQVGVPQPLETTPYQADPSIEEQYINPIPQGQR